jgi:hypothetical protein
MQDFSRSGNVWPEEWCTKDRLVLVEDPVGQALRSEHVNLRQPPAEEAHCCSHPLCVTRCAHPDPGPQLLPTSLFPWSSLQNSSPCLYLSLYFTSFSAAPGLKPHPSSLLYHRLSAYHSFVSCHFSMLLSSREWEYGGNVLLLVLDSPLEQNVRRHYSCWCYLYSQMLNTGVKEWDTGVKAAWVQILLPHLPSASLATSYYKFDN